MSRPQPPASQSFNTVVGLLGVVWLSVVAGIFFADIRKTHRRRSVDPVAQHNEKSLAPVKGVDEGWFPGERDPYFNFDSDTQGWRYEQDDPQALAPSAGEASDAEPQPKENNAAPATLTVVDPPPEASVQNRGKVLAVPVSFPDPATIFRDNNTPLNRIRLAGVRYISYDVYVPPDASGFIGCLFFVKDKDGLWYQARSKTALLPGRWTTIAADIRGESSDVSPLGHLGQWDENQATRVRTVGMTFYGDKPYKGTILVDNFRGWMRPQRFKQMLDSINGPSGEPVAQERLDWLKAISDKATQHKDPPLRAMNFRTDPGPAGDDPVQSSPPVVRKFETLTVRFELNRQVDNPFDPEKADVTCRVESPSGVVTEHVGFWYQEYDRAPRFSGEELVPIGRPEWRVRITPREVGEYRYTVTVRLGAKSGVPEELSLPARSFSCIPSDRPGFIRVSEKDSRFFELENGEFFYPIGHNVHTPIDIRCWREVLREEAPAGRGLPMYDEFFATMQKSGQNTAEIWMAAWWVGIEWTSKWRNYYGPRRYSLQNAWKLDTLLEMARKRGIYVHLVLDNHGKFSAWCDWEWDLNPYNRNCDSDGIVDTAPEFFTNEITRKLHKNRLRYIAARWGPDPAILGWELVSEYDLVGGQNRHDSGARNNFHRSPTLQNWAKEMITYLRLSDVYQHPITNHYASDCNWIDLALARMTVEDTVPKVNAKPNSGDPVELGEVKRRPLFDYVVADAYRPDRNFTGIAQRSHAWLTSQLHGANVIKPFWITEYGGDWNAATPQALEADVHCGMWASWMTDAAGTPLFWWYDLVHQKELNGYYKAFSNYIKGEDRRGIKGQAINLAITAGSGGLRGNAYRWNTGAYAWVYNHGAMENMPPRENRPRHEGVEAVLPDLEPGKYKIEYWDCYDGVVATSEEKELTAGQQLALKFPPFASNMAVKVKRVGGEATASQPAETPPAPQSQSR
ncbi:MAG TPA: DUF5060 domain-containing protein [Planctomycetota bacterium]|nr:DUF5060 domain-containing protein [Planctomycetota bacterium]